MEGSTNLSIRVSLPWSRLIGSLPWTQPGQAVQSCSNAPADVSPSCRYKESLHPLYFHSLTSHPIMYSYRAAATPHGVSFVSGTNLSYQGDGLRPGNSAVACPVLRGSGREVCLDSVLLYLYLYSSIPTFIDFPNPQECPTSIFRPPVLQHRTGISQRSTASTHQRFPSSSLS